jgi:UDP-GlcNAc3NAcA epimerase
MKIVTVVGARPQFVKAAMLSRALRRAGAGELLVHTGQHYDVNMSDVFFRQLEIPEPNVHLGVGSGPHGNQTGRMLSGIEQVLMKERPEWLVVYGDTNSTLAGALAAAKLHVPVAHIEAGLRSFNRRMPEEVNRVVTDHVSTLLLAPTPTAVHNLEREGIDAARVHAVGDVMKDAALHFVAVAESDTTLPDDLGVTKGNYILATVHRAENTDDPARLSAIMDALVQVGRSRPVVLPLHPRTRAALDAAGLRDRVSDGCVVTEPVGYLEMLVLEKNAALVVTDSGGVQKEAFFFDVPCVTVRDETEWTELVELGWNCLAPPTSAAAVAAAVTGQTGRRGAESTLFGAGDAADRIADLLMAGPA